MNSMIKKMLVFLLVMAAVAAVGYFGRKAYKNATERRALAEARQYLDKKDARNAVLCLQRALQINPFSIPAAKIMADMLESAGMPAALGWRIRAAQLQTGNITNRLLWAQTAIKLRDAKSATEALGGVDEKGKSTAMYHKLSGALAWSLGQREEADKQYREALRLEPDNLAIVLNLQTMGLASTNSAVAKAARVAMEQMTTNTQFRLVALHYLTADATARKSYAEAMNYSAEIARDPAATTADKIEYLQLLHVANSANFAPWLASLKTAATHSPEEAFLLGRWMALTGNPGRCFALACHPAANDSNQSTRAVDDRGLPYRPERLGGVG